MQGKSLSADQIATLQLVLERGQSYGDLAKLLGVDEAEVRSRARAALTALAGADPDRNVALSDYLLGQADPIDRADAVRHLREHPDDHRLASALATELREMFPAAELPRLPGEPRAGGLLRRAPAGPPPSGESAAGAAAGVSLSGPQTRFVVILASAAVLLIGVVLGLTGAFGGDDDEPAATTAATETGDGDEIERVTLRAPGGGDARGEAVFGLATGDQPYVDLEVTGLDPPPNDRAYVLWLMLTESQGYPLTPLQGVSPQGTFRDRFAIPSAALSLVARVRFVDVSIAPVREIAEIVQQALENTSLVLRKPGETVLRGTVPRAAPANGAEQG